MKISSKYRLNFAILGALNAIVVVVGIYGIFLADDPAKRPLAIALIVGAALVVAFVVILISNMLDRSLFKPLLTATGIATEVGDTGNFRIGKEALTNLKKCAELKDEIGDLARALDRLIYSLNIKTDILEILAEGDMRVDVPVHGDDDLMGISLRKVIDNLNSMNLEVRTGAEQLSIGISQLSTAAQSLAASTTEQSATVQTLLSSTSDIALKAEQNAKRTDEATKLSVKIKGNASDGRGAMERMTQAMEDISDAGQSIGSVMKAIDEIAFQTNILALNAAVEAARAGQHGRGFAVVADEVRNLASKSANAANSSNALIEDTLKKTGVGSQIVRDTSEYLGKILGGVDDSAQIIDEISNLTSEQGDAIDEVNRGISDLTNVVYQNSATAEQSAAATDEMDTQIKHLLDLVGRFKIKDKNFTSHEPTRTERLAMEANETPIMFNEAKPSSSSKRAKSHADSANASPAHAEPESAPVIPPSAPAELPVFPSAPVTPAPPKPEPAPAPDESPADTEPDISSASSFDDKEDFASACEYTDGESSLPDDKSKY